MTTEQLSRLAELRETRELWYAEDDYTTPEERAEGKEPFEQFNPAEALELATLEREEMLEALRALTAWNEKMGGWEAPCWQQAQDIVRRNSGSDPH